jgi:hypothetical protein
MRNSLRFCELGSNCFSVRHPITIMDIKRSCEEAKIDFEGNTLENVLDILERNYFLSKDGATYTVKIREIIEKMMLDSGEFFYCL